MSSTNSGIIRSDLDFINDKMDNIQLRVSKSNEVCSNNHSVNSSNDKNMLFSKMNSMVDNYYNVQNELMSKINQEAKFIKNIGEQYAQLDQSMGQEVDKL